MPFAARSGFFNQGGYWIATLGGTNRDTGRGITVDQFGNVYVVGESDSPGGESDNFDIIIAKYNNKGEIQWQRGLGAFEFVTDDFRDFGYDIAVDSSGDIYFTSEAKNHQFSGGALILTGKYNASGELQWLRQLGENSNDRGRGIAIDGSDNVYVVGETNANGNKRQLLIAKYNDAGTIQWQRSIGAIQVANPPDGDAGFGIAIDGSDNVYVVGKTDANGGAGGNDILIAKYNDAGTIQWQRSLGGSSNDIGHSIAADTSGNVYIVGSTNSEGAGGNDILIAKYNTSGEIQWQRSLGGSANDIGYDIAVDGLGAVYIVGKTDSAGGAGGLDILITKYNTSGEIQWQRSLGGTGDSRGFGIAVDTSGAVYVTGDTGSQGAGNIDLFIAKLPATGSRTGTIGNVTYQERTLTDSARTLTALARTLITSNRNLTEVVAPMGTSNQSANYVDSARTLTSSTTLLP